MNDRAKAIHAARQWLSQSPLFLDTETTGLDNTAEICDLAVINHDGIVLLDTLVKPTIPIPRDAYDVHGISNADVVNAPTFAEVMPDFARIVGDRTVVIYNLDYDTRILRQSAAAHGLRLTDRFGLETVEQFNQWYGHWHCAMELYAQFYGEWNERYGNYRWQKLGNAARQCGIRIPTDLHRARADAELTRQVIHHVAKADPWAKENARISDW